MPTAISNLWTPAIWVPAVSERANKYPAVINSGAVVRTAEIAALASGGGTIVNVPTFRDIRDQDDGIQVESTAPTKQKLTSGIQLAPPLNRVTANGATALAAAVTGEDPIAEMTGQIGDRRAIQRVKALAAILRGFMGSSAMADARTDAFVEVIGNQDDELHFITVNRVIDAMAKLGENMDLIRMGAMFAHPQIRAALMKLDAASFKNGLESGLPFTTETYRGIPIFVSSALARAGTTSGTVYETYFCGPGTIGMGEKPQVADQVDVASLSFDLDKEKNEEFIYDRTRTIIHPNGARFTGSPDGQSATNAELATVGNWGLAYTSADRVGIAMLRTNG